MGFSPIHRARFSQLPTILLALTVGGSLAAPKAYAQQAEPSAPAHLAFVEGDALLDREDRTESATGSVPFVPGDRLRTQAGRAEVLFPDGSALEVDNNSDVELQGAAILRLTAGRVALIVSGTGTSQGRGERGA